MKDMINYLFSQIGDEYTHTLKNVTTESLNCHNIFKTFVDDGNKLDEKEKLLNHNEGILRSIIDDIVVWSTVRDNKYFVGVNTLQGEDLKCIIFNKKPHVVTDYGMGVIWKDDDEKILGYAHRTKNGCRLIDMQNISLDGGYRPIGIVLDDKVDYNKYIVAFRNDTIEKSDKYVTCTFKDNKILIIDNVNDIIYDYEKSNDIYNIKPISYDLFTYRRSDGTNCIFSKYYNKTLNEFSSDYDILRIITGYPDVYDASGVVILYLPEWDMVANVIKGGDVYISSLVARNKEDKGRCVILNKELTHIFKTVHGLDMFYCVVPKKDDEEQNRFIFFKMEDGKLKTDVVKATSIPGEIYVCKDTCCITLEYDTNGYHQVASFWEDEMDMYKYSHIDIRLNKGVDVNVVLTKFKDHIDSLNAESEMGDDEYFNLHNFNKLSPGVTIDGQQYMESDQFANITRNEVYNDIYKIYMSYNGKVQLRQRTDNIVEEYISINVGKTEERQNKIKEMYNETINEHDRIINEMKNESSNQNNTNNNN